MPRMRDQQNQLDNLEATIKFQEADVLEEIVALKEQLAFIQSEIPKALFPKTSLTAIPFAADPGRKRAVCVRHRVHGG